MQRSSLQKFLFHYLNSFRDIVSVRSSSRRINHIFPDKHNELFWLKAHNKQSSQIKICGRTAHDYVVTVAPGSPSNLCGTLGIAYNGRFQEEMSWYLVIGGGCKVFICCNPSCSRRFLGGRGALKVSWVGLFFSKYHVTFSCSLLFLSLGKNVPTLSPRSFSPYILFC